MPTHGKCLIKTYTINKEINLVTAFLFKFLGSCYGGRDTIWHLLCDSDALSYLVTFCPLLISQDNKISIIWHYCKFKHGHQNQALRLCYNVVIKMIWCILILSGVNSPLISSSTLGTYRPGTSSFSVLCFCLFILFTGFSRQEHWSGLPFLSPVDHVLSELSTKTHPSSVALHGMAHSFIELDKSVVHVIRLVSFLWLWFSVCPMMENAKECSNYCTIALISYASKVMFKSPQARLQQYVNHELPDVQAGFRKGRGTRVQIANFHWIIEKAREFQKNIYFCFIDYAKGFDCMDHNKLWKILKEMGIPDHLICLLRTLHEGQEATVRTGHGTTD